MSPSLKTLSERAAGSTEIDARMRRFATSHAVPSPDDIRRAREWLGLSQDEFAHALGFGPNGGRVVRKFETPAQVGLLPFIPTNTSIIAMRALVVFKMIYLDPVEENVRVLIFEAMPEVLR